MRLGFAPITWNNEDLQEELGPFVEHTRVFDEIAAAGYEGTELGDGFPREAAALRAALDHAGGSPTRAARLLGQVGRGRSSDPGGTVRAMMKRLRIG